MFKNLMFFTILIGISVAAKSATTINGAGATFPEPVYTKWFSEFQKTDDTVTINYQGIGSGGGIRQLTAGTVDFGASDSPMTSDEMKAAKKPVVHIPTVLGAVVVSYNLKLTQPLRLTGELVADIFQGKITQWNDPKITAVNKGLTLPAQAIVVATRSDGSGTTAVFTDYLSKVSPSWSGKSGKTVDWFSGSVAAKGNAGVAGLIKQNEGTIGYIELVYALENKIPFAWIQNKSGQFIEANMETVTNAAKGTVEEMVKNDFKLSITNSATKNAYPISSFTWLLVFESMDQSKGVKIKKLIEWALGDTGQSMAQKLNYAALPKELRTKVLARTHKLTFNAGQ